MEEDTNAKEWFKKEVERAKAAFPEEPRENPTPKKIKINGAEIGLIVTFSAILLCLAVIKNGGGLFAVVDYERQQDWLCVKYAPLNASDCLVCSPSQNLNENRTICVLNEAKETCTPKCEIEVRVRYGEGYNITNIANSTLGA